MILMIVRMTPLMVMVVVMVRMVMAVVEMY